MDMSKGVVLLLVLVFLTESCLIAFKPVSAASPNSWETKAPMQVARSKLGVAVVNGKIYAIGGSTRSGGGGTRNGALPVTGGTVGTNEEYDPATDTWTFKAPMPTPWEYFATAVYQNKIYCIGSRVNEVYDPATDTWENKTAMPTARVALEANVVGDKIYLIGGFVNGSRVTLNEVYDPATDSWTTAAPMPKAALDYASAVFDNKIYFIDGYPENSHPLLHQIYDPETDTWSQGAPSPSSTQHGAAGATTGVNSRKRIYVLGETWNLWQGEPSYTVRVYDPMGDTWTFGANIPTSRLDFGVAVVNDILYAIGGFTESYPDMPYSYSYGPTITPYATNEQYTPIGYGTSDPSYDGTAPEIAVVFPENRTYYSVDVALNFTVNEQVSSMRYELDGETAVEVSGNTTLNGLAYGAHNLTIYAVDVAGNTGASDTICFTIAESEPFPTELAITASGAFVAVVVVGLLVYFRKRKR
jgi:N-acetylneuraminic acid mutarotase